MHSTLHFKLEAWRWFADCSWQYRLLHIYINTNRDTQRHMCTHTYANQGAAEQEQPTWACPSASAFAAVLKNTDRLSMKVANARRTDLLVEEQQGANRSIKAALWVCIH